MHVKASKWERFAWKGDQFWVSVSFERLENSHFLCLLLFICQHLHQTAHLGENCPLLVSLNTTLVSHSNKTTMTHVQTVVTRCASFLTAQRTFFEVMLPKRKIKQRSSSIRYTCCRETAELLSHAICCSERAHAAHTHQLEMSQLDSKNERVFLGESLKRESFWPKVGKLGDSRALMESTVNCREQETQLSLFELYYELYASYSFFVTFYFL